MELKGYLLAASASILWGFLGFYGVELSHYKFSGNDIAFVRMLFGFISGFTYLAISSKRRKHLKLHIPNGKYILGIGIVSQGLMNLFLYTSVLRVGSVTATMLVCLGPLFTVLISAVMFKEKLTLEKQLALAFAILGSFLMITQGKLVGLKLDFLGVLAGLAAGLCYGFYPIFGKKAESKLSPLTTTVYSFMVAAIFLAPFVDLKKVLFSLLNFKVLLFALMLGIVHSFIAYIFYLRAITFIPPSKASIIAMLELPTAAVVAVLVLGESLNEYKLVGLLMIMGGILIMKINFDKLFSKFRGKKVIKVDSK